MSSFGEIRAQRLKNAFIGRAPYLDAFERNLASAPEKREYVVAITGPSGAGKTFLAKRFRQLAAARDFRTAMLDRHDFDLLGALSRLSHELDPELRHFSHFDR